VSTHAASQTDAQAQTEIHADTQTGTERMKEGGREGEIRGDMDAEEVFKDRVRLLEVQLAATREILSLQDRWLVSAGAVSIIDPPAVNGRERGWEEGDGLCGEERELSQGRLGDLPYEELRGGCVQGENGVLESDGKNASRGVVVTDKQAVGDRILHEWRQQVYVLLLEKASHAAEHERTVTAVKRDMADLESQVLGLRAELDMGRQAQVDLKAQVTMHKNQFEGQRRRTEALIAEGQQANQEREREKERDLTRIHHLQQERQSVMLVLAAASASLAPPAGAAGAAGAAAAAAKPRRVSPQEGSKADGALGLTALAAADTKLAGQQSRLTFAVKRLAAAKACC
jgi:hypothetical protein